MRQDDALNYFSYPDPARMPTSRRMSDVVYEVNLNALTEVPDFSRFFPPTVPDNNKKEAETDDNSGLRKLEALKASGLSELELEKLREKLQEGFSAVIDQVFSSLTADVVPVVASQILNQEMDLRSLMAASRRGESISKSERELAEDIVIGSLVNWGNEVWDPNDPLTSCATENNLLRTLLKY